MYIVVRRNFRFPMFEVFDAPVTAVSCPARDVTTVASQALWSLNNRSVWLQAAELASRVVQEGGDDRGAWVERAWRIAMARPPSAEEKQEALKLMDTFSQQASEGDTSGSSGTAPLVDLPKNLGKLPPSQALALVKLCLGVYNLNEFAFVD
jgi:hypothetical protein